MWGNNSHTSFHAVCLQVHCHCPWYPELKWVFRQIIEGFKQLLDVIASLFRDNDFSVAVLGFWIAYSAHKVVSLADGYSVLLKVNIISCQSPGLANSYAREKQKIE